MKYECTLELDYSAEKYTSIEISNDLQTYIIGGIVDRVREPHIPPDASRVAAEQDWIECRKLPIDKYVQLVFFF